MLRYAVTIFLSAFLLFQVQPLISKYILPWFGGIPSVWTTCMLFFQVVLLAGYSYAHGVNTWLSQRKQVVVHLVMLGVALVLLALTMPPSGGWKPRGDEDPTWRILLLLGASVGLPYFMLSTTGPLLQAWFSRTNPGRSPYRLYSLSNVGSLLALISFPFVVERWLTSGAQSTIWSVGFGLFAVACGYVALKTWNLAAPEPAAAAPQASDLPVDDSPDLRVRLLWLALPACASMLLLATTHKICQDVAVVPFLWILPLSLYLLTFIICFDNERWYFRPVFWPLFLAAIALVVWLLFRGVNSSVHKLITDIGLAKAPVFKNWTTVSASIQTQVVGYAVGLFICCMVCHGELVRLKPSPRHLTSFYLMISLGGALGGIFVGMIAPDLFRAYWEFDIALWGALACALAALWYDLKRRRLAAYAGQPAGRPSMARMDVLLVGCVVAALACALFMLKAAPRFKLYEEYSYAMWGLGAAVVILVWHNLEPHPRGWPAWYARLILPLGLVALVVLGEAVRREAESTTSYALALSRNFYGVLRVAEYGKNDPEYHHYTLANGRISHGWQLRSPEGRLRPVSYFAPASGVGLTFANYPRNGKGLRVGVLGLGVGTFAAYGKEGDDFTFYEINPECERVANKWFTYLKDLKERAGDDRVDVRLGDGRLTLERELAEGKPQGFDILALDAFSSDAVPIHLLTKEAFVDIYLKHMKPDGVILVNITNRYIDLHPVVNRLVEELNREAEKPSKRAAESGDPAQDSKPWRTALIEYDGEPPDYILTCCTWMLVTRNAELLDCEAIRNAAEASTGHKPRSVRLWTDDFSNLFEILRWK